MTASQYRVLSKIVEKKRRGERRKQLEKRRERKKTVVAPSQVTNLVKTRAADRETFGVQWRIENGAQTSIVPATSGIVKYDRLLVKWDENIGCRLASVLPLAFPPPLPLRSCVVFHLCSSAGQCGTACHEMTMTIRLSCKSIFVSWSRSSFSPPLNFFGFIGETYLYLLIGVPSTSCPQFSLVSFSRATSCFWFFRIPGAKRHFADTAAKRIVSRPRWMSCEITVGIPCLLRTRLKLLLPGEQILSKLVSLYCYLSAKENSLEWQMHRTKGWIRFDSDNEDNLESVWSISGERNWEIRSEASRWTHWKRIYLRGKLMVERRSDEWICLFSFFLLQISLH